MSADGRPEPVRSCVGCRERRRCSLLVRVTGRNGRLVVDGPSDGRGAWLCRSHDGPSIVDDACLDLAIRRHGFARVWRREVSAAEHDDIRRAVASAGRRRPSDAN